MLGRMNNPLNTAVLALPWGGRCRVRINTAVCAAPTRRRGSSPPPKTRRRAARLSLSRLGPQLLSAAPHARRVLQPLATRLAPS